MVVGTYLKPPTRSDDEREREKHEGGGGTKKEFEAGTEVRRLGGKEWLGMRELILGGWVLQSR